MATARPPSLLLEDPDPSDGTGLGTLSGTGGCESMGDIVPLGPSDQGDVRRSKQRVAVS